MGTIYSQDWEDGQKHWVKTQDEGDFAIDNVALSSPLGGTVSASSFVFEQGNGINVGDHGETDYVFAQGNPVDNSGESSVVYESGTGLGGSGGSGDRALEAIETTGGGTSGTAVADSSYSGFDGQWTYDLLVYHEEMPQNDFQRWKPIPVSDTDGENYVQSRWGYDSNADPYDFKLSGHNISSSTTKSKSEWKTQTWYHLKVKHDGSGGYEAKEWQPNNESEPAYEISASGSAPVSNRRPGIYVNGAPSGNLTIHQAKLEITN